MAASLGLGLGERAFGIVQHLDPGRQVALGVQHVVGELSLLRLQRHQLRGLLAELELEPADGLALLADLGELIGGLGLELLDAHFEAPRRHGEFGAQLILFSLDFHHR